MDPDQKPDLNVQHKLKGPIVEQIRNLCFGLYDTKSFDVIAQAHPDDPTKWQCIARSNALLLIGTLTLVSGPSDSILGGLLGLVGVLLTAHGDRYRRMCEAMDLNAKLQINNTWSFDES